MVSVRELSDKAQTGAEMYRLVHEFSGDINEFETPDGRRLSDIPLPEYFDIVRNVPYRLDDYGVEVVTRPLHLFSSPWIGWDCKKKAIAIAAWLKENQIPFRFTSVSKRPDGQIHHVIVEASHGGEWLEIDATYPQNLLGTRQEWTNKEPLESPGPALLGSAKLVSMYGVGDPSPSIVQEFTNRVRGMAPEQMGEPATIIAAIIGVVGTIVATVIGVVSAKRRDESAKEHQIEMARLNTELMIQQAEEQRRIQQEIQDQAEPAGLPGWMIPAAIAGGLLFLL